jgi:hypothetical protein
MEPVEGETWRSRSRAAQSHGRRLPVAARRRGAEAAHEQGIVHRDLKPANARFARTARLVPTSAWRRCSSRCRQAPGMSGTRQRCRGPQRTPGSLGTAAHVARAGAWQGGGQTGRHLGIWRVFYEMLTGRRSTRARRRRKSWHASLKENPTRALPRRRRHRSGNSAVA